ncbi:hypothetical protein IE077_002212, partial [Cardiosporidium cionae]
TFPDLLQLIRAVAAKVTEVVNHKTSSIETIILSFQVLIEICRMPLTGLAALFDLPQHSSEQVLSAVSFLKNKEMEDKISASANSVVRLFPVLNRLTECIRLSLQTFEEDISHAHLWILAARKLVILCNQLADICSSPLAAIFAALFENTRSIRWDFASKENTNAVDIYGDLGMGDSLEASKMMDSSHPSDPRKIALKELLDALNTLTAQTQFSLPTCKKDVLPAKKQFLGHAILALGEVNAFRARLLEVSTEAPSMLIPLSEFYRVSTHWSPSKHQTSFWDVTGHSDFLFHTLLRRLESIQSSNSASRSLYSLPVQDVTSTMFMDILALARNLERSSAWKRCAHLEKLVLEELKPEEVADPAEDAPVLPAWVSDPLTRTKTKAKAETLVEIKELSSVTENRGNLGGLLGRGGHVPSRSRPEPKHPEMGIDLFRGRKSSSSRAPSKHVDDYEAAVAAASSQVPLPAGTSTRTGSMPAAPMDTAFQSLPMEPFNASTEMNPSSRMSKNDTSILSHLPLPLSDASKLSSTVVETIEAMPFAVDDSSEGQRLESTAIPVSHTVYQSLEEVPQESQKEYFPDPAATCRPVAFPIQGVHLGRQALTHAERNKHTNSTLSPEMLPGDPFLAMPGQTHTLKYTINSDASTASLPHSLDAISGSSHVEGDAMPWTASHYNPMGTPVSVGDSSPQLSQETFGVSPNNRESIPLSPSMHVEETEFEPIPKKGRIDLNFQLESFSCSDLLPNMAYTTDRMDPPQGVEFNSASIPSVIAPPFKPLVPQTIFPGAVAPPLTSSLVNPSFAGDDVSSTVPINIPNANNRSRIAPPSSTLSRHSLLGPSYIPTGEYSPVSPSIDHDSKTPYITNVGMLNPPLATGKSTVYAVPPMSVPSNNQALPTIPSQGHVESLLEPTAVSSTLSSSNLQTSAGAVNNQSLPPKPQQYTDIPGWHEFLRDGQNNGLDVLSIFERPMQLKDPRIKSRFLKLLDQHTNVKNYLNIFGGKF